MAVVSAAFTVTGAVLVDGAYYAAPGATITASLTNPSQVNSVVWSIVGNDKSTRANPVLTTSGSSPAGSTVQLTIPADPQDGLGQAYMLQCDVSDGASPANKATARAVVGQVNALGIVPSPYGELLDRDPVYGWTQVFNKILAGGNIGGSATATTAGATTTVVLSLPVGIDQTCAFRVFWHGRGGSNIARRESTFTAYRLASANVAQLGATVDLLATAKTDPTWGALDFVLNTGTQAVDVRVAGKAATPIAWDIRAEKRVY